MLKIKSRSSNQRGLGREFFLQFSPKTHFHFGLPPVGNVLRLEAAEPFTVDSIQYLTGNNASVDSEEICKAGTSIKIPISDDYINKVQPVGPRHNHDDGSAPLQFSARHPERRNEQGNSTFSRHQARTHPNYAGPTLGEKTNRLISTMPGAH